ncbi:MAG: winged helix-turn-helix domain-containing protein [Pseudoxanthomonas sp.]
MLNPSSYPLHQESDRLKVGEFVVDLPRREVVSALQAEPVRLTVKAIHVLLALVGQHGKVVSREALLEWVWPDTLPTDDVLTQAIGQLRKAFCDDRDSPRYLETISKGGYRLMAAVEWLDAETIEVAAPVVQVAPVVIEASIPEPLKRTGQTAKRTRFVPAAIAAACLLAVGAGALIYLQGDKKKGLAETAPRSAAGTDSAPESLAFITITSRPGRETNPSLSPDGALVAYEQIDEENYGRIMIQTSAHVPPRALTNPPPGHSDAMPVWSHDGRRLAFVRHDQASQCRIMTVASSGGNERMIADCFGGSASTYDWTPDDSGLLMGMVVKPADEASSPLRLLDIASGKWHTFDYAISNGDIDIDPRYSPDGRWIVFRRNISLSDLWKMPASGGKPQRLTSIKSDIRGWDWLPDGSGLIFSYIGSATFMHRYDMATGRITPLEMSEVALTPDIARASPSMVFTVDRSVAGIFRISLDASRGGKPVRERVFASSGSEMLPAVSPDNRMLAFISDRGSRQALWVGELDKPDAAREIESIMPVPRHNPVWSEDSRKLLVIGNPSTQQLLYEVDVESGRAEALPVPASSPIYAAYTDDPKHLLVGADGGEGRLRVALYDRSVTPWRELASLDDVALVKYDSAHRIVYFTRMSKPGLWRSDMRLGGAELVDESHPHVPSEYKRWSIGPDAVYFLDWSEDCATGWIKMGEPRSKPALCLERKVESWPVGPSLDRSGKSLYVTMDVSNSSDIGWADLSAMTSGTVAAKTVKR